MDSGPGHHGVANTQVIFTSNSDKGQRTKNYKQGRAIALDLVG